MPFDAFNLPALVNAATAAKHVIGCSERKFHELRHEEKFPKAVDLPGTSLRRWRTSELLAWVAALPSAVDRASEPTQLQGTDKRPMHVRAKTAAAELPPLPVRRRRQASASV